MVHILNESMCLFETAYNCRNVKKFVFLGECLRKLQPRPQNMHKLQNACATRVPCVDPRISHPVT